MKKRAYYTLILALIAFAPVSFANAQAASTVSKEKFYAQVDRLLKTHVRDGQVNYKLLQQHQKQLASITSRIGKYDLSKASANEKKAFYINAYNMLVWQQVMQHYPLKSVMDVPGFFDKHKFKVAGEMLTLNDLEKKKLMATYQDARIHFALVCAAKSCPPLPDKAFTPATIEAQLQAQTKRTLQDRNFIRIAAKTNQVQVSEIFKWYKVDFLREAASITAYINKFRNSPLPSGSIKYYNYDWGLNDVTGK